MKQRKNIQHIVPMILDKIVEKSFETFSFIYNDTIVINKVLWRTVQREINSVIVATLAVIKIVTLKDSDYFFYF